MDEITIRVWDDGHKELVAEDVMEFEAKDGRIGSKNVVYVPRKELNILKHRVRDLENIMTTWQNLQRNFPPCEVMELINDYLEVNG